MTALAGVGQLVRFMLRRDRVFLPVWVVSLVGIVYVSLRAVHGLYDTPEAIAAYANTVASSPASVALVGPPFAMDQIGGILIYETSSTALLGVALMAVFTVVRHTRREEDAGRIELLGSTVVSPHAVITAAVLVSSLASVLVGLGVAGSFLAEAQPFEQSMLYGASVAALGLVFTGVAAAAAQLMSHGRGAVGASLGFLALVFGLRAVGDVQESNLSWLSPMGWSQQVGVYELDRWWPLGLSLLFTGAMLALTVALESRRDLGSGILTPRPGPAAAGALLSGVVGLAWRLQRGALLGWAVGFVAMAVMLGSFSESIEDMISENPALSDVFATAAAETLVDAYMAVSLLLLSIGVSGYAVASALRMRGEEATGRLEPVLATAVSRHRWIGGNLLVTLLGTLVLVLSGGIGLAAAFAVTTGRSDKAVELVGASLAYLPAILLVAGVAVLLFGVAPRVTGLVWFVVAFSFVVGWLGELLDMPSWAESLSPFSHLPAVPAEGLAATPVLVLSAVTVLVVAVGWSGFRRRDIG